jgi:hypothetical protein
MTEQLRKAIEQVEQLSAAEQDHIAALMLEEVASEERWEALFDDPRSERALAQMVAEAIAEDEAGLTRDLCAS